MKKPHGFVAYVIVGEMHSLPHVWTTADFLDALRAAERWLSDRETYTRVTIHIAYDYTAVTDQIWIDGRLVK